MSFADGDHSVVDPRSAKPPPPEPKVSVLMVDDQASNLVALEAMLQELGQNLVKASSGKEALKRLFDEDFAVILMDVRMPDLDGFETAALIRQRDKSRHTPIIFLTAYERNDVQMFTGYSLGAVDYLFKPLIPEVLRSKVAVFVELFRKREQVLRQAELLREKERQEHEAQLAEEKQRWEMQRLREAAEKDKKTAEMLAKRAEELARLNREIQEANRRKDEFLAMLGHELRNPLAPMLNALHIMRLGADEPSTFQEMRDILERQVRHMCRLIDDLLDVSRIARGKIELRKQPVELGQIIKRAVESTRPLIEQHRHELVVEPLPEPVWLHADPTRLEQVLANLLNNAAKFTPPGGRIELTAEQAGAEIVLSVRDNGIGIPSDMLDRVFELFAQLDRTLASPSQWGMGVGLALVRNLVELHGGSVRAHSAGRGRGSEFVIRLPAVSGPPLGQSEPVSQAPGRAVSPARILVVDDNHDAAESLTQALRLEGHVVYTANDGPGALQVARLYHPQVVFLDIGLPGMNGYEVARRLREQERLADLLLVAMTGYGQDEDRRRSREAGFDLHMVKPVELTEIRQLLASLSLESPCNRSS